MPLPLLGAMAVGGGIKALGSLFGGSAANKQAKTQAANQNAQAKAERDAAQKKMDRMRKIMQGLRRAYGKEGLISARGAQAINDYFGDLGQDVDASAYTVPDAPVMRAATTSPWMSGLSGLLGGASDVLANSSSGRAPIGPQIGGGATAPRRPVPMLGSGFGVGTPIDFGTVLG